MKTYLNLFCVIDLVLKLISILQILQRKKISDGRWYWIQLMIFWITKGCRKHGENLELWLMTDAIQPREDPHIEYKSK